MTQLEEIRNTTARSAIAAALEAARASYEEIARARDELNELESSGVYVEGYIEEQRQQRADATLGSVEGRLSGARRRIESAISRIEADLGRAAGEAVDTAEYAAATAQFQMVLGSSLADDPERLLGLYEGSFDNPVDRKVIEDLAQRVLAVMEDGPPKMIFEERWKSLAANLVERLPVEQRQARGALEELERSAEYLATVEQLTTAAIRGLTDPRVGGNLTAFAKVHTYEQELAGSEASAIKETLPTASSAAGMQRAS